MESKIFSQFEFARKKRNLKIMEELYNNNPKDIFIKFEYAKLLIERKFVDDGIQLLKELLPTENCDYAMLELGKVYFDLKEFDEARKYFKKLACKGDAFGMLELGILEKSQGNYDLARELLNKALEKK